MNLQESLSPQHKQIVKKPNVYVENIPNDANIVHILGNDADPASPLNPALVFLDHAFTVSVPYKDFVVLHLYPDVEYHVFAFTTSAQADKLSTALAKLTSNKQANPFPYNVKQAIE